MTVVLDSKFATAEDAAKILGIPKSRVKWLKKLAESRTVSSTRNGKGSASRFERKKAEPAKRKHARGKGKKAAR